MAVRTELRVCADKFDIQRGHPAPVTYFYTLTKLSMDHEL